MFKSYIALALRNIARDKLFAFINLAGVALAIAWATVAGHAFRTAKANPI